MCADDGEVDCCGCTLGDVVVAGGVVVSSVSVIVVVAAVDVVAKVNCVREASAMTNPMVDIFLGPKA